MAISNSSLTLLFHSLNVPGLLQDFVVTRLRCYEAFLLRGFLVAKLLAGGFPLPDFYAGTTDYSGGRIGRIAAPAANFYLKFSGRMMLEGYRDPDLCAA